MGVERPIKSKLRYYEVNYLGVQIFIVSNGVRLSPMR